MGGVRERRPDEVRAWLAKKPSLDELRAEFPQEWDAVQRELVAVVSQQDPAVLEAYVAKLSADGAATSRTGPVLAGSAKERDRVAAHVRREMAITALRKHCLAVAAGVSGTVRFNLVNGWLAQRLLFRQDLERKPVSLRWFRLVWPRLSQRDLLMPLVQPKGIYCFYSAALLDELVGLIDGRRCLEIAAGDGTLSRFLAARGVEITASDDFSWQGRVRYPDVVVREDARESLKRRAPEVVLCSWPPSGNVFERHVFRTRSVALYVVIGSRHRFASGDWDAYERQTDFELEERPDLAELVLPPELESGVYVFRRRTASPPG